MNEGPFGPVQTACVWLSVPRRGSLRVTLHLIACVPTVRGQASPAARRFPKCSALTVSWPLNVSKFPVLGCRAHHLQAGLDFSRSGKEVFIAVSLKKKERKKTSNVLLYVLCLIKCCFKRALQRWRFYSFSVLKCGILFWKDDILLMLLHLQNAVTMEIVLGPPSERLNYSDGRDRPTRGCRVSQTSVRK